MAMLHIAVAWPFCNEHFEKRLGIVWDIFSQRVSMVMLDGELTENEYDCTLSFSLYYIVRILYNENGIKKHIRK